MLTSSSQIRQGIAQNTKGTAFVVYEDVMDAKQACDKLNGFNFQSRYLVGMSPRRLGGQRAIKTDGSHSALPPAREDGEIERRPSRETRKSRKAQKAAWDRLGMDDTT